MEIFPVPLPFAVVWEDEDLLAVNKPSFMPVYPTPGHDRDSLANAVAFHYQQQGGTAGFHPLYRLDRNTSGLLVVGKHAYAASRLAFSIEKEYTALCEGVLTGEGTIRAPIRRKEGSRILREVGDGPHIAAGGHPLAGVPGLLRVYIAQDSAGDRAHPSNPGAFFPYGASAFGGRFIWRKPGTDRPPCPALFPCAVHPSGDQPSDAVESPLPEDMQAVLE